MLQSHLDDWIVLRKFMKQKLNDMTKEIDHRAQLMVEVRFRDFERNLPVNFTQNGTVFKTLTHSDILSKMSHTPHYGDRDAETR